MLEMTRPQRTALHLVLLAVACLVLAACGGGTGECPANTSTRVWLIDQNTGQCASVPVCESEACR